MRLKDTEVTGIINGIEPFITVHTVELRLYGSRVDNNKKGGDIDLMLIVPPDAKNHMREIKHKILAEIKKNIGDRKIDLLICDALSLESDPFIAVIFPYSISLKEWKR